MDKLNALAMFVATAETGSFSRGAERLGKTPSALTKAVAHLEAELGARLFERTTRSLALTEAGQIYLEAARQSLETLRTAGQEIELCLLYTSPSPRPSPSRWSTSSACSNARSRRCRAAPRWPSRSNAGPIATSTMWRAAWPPAWSAPARAAAMRSEWR